MKKLATTICLSTLLVCFPLYAEEIYKWVDEHGRTHYGERAPSKTDVQQIQIKQAPPVDNTIHQRKVQRRKLLEVYEEEREEKKKAQALAKKQRAEQKRKCQLAKNELRDYQIGGSMYEIDDNGQRRFLTEEDFATRIAYWQKRVDAFCK